jgi:hypothetical protein
VYISRGKDLVYVSSEIVAGLRPGPATWYDITRGRVFCNTFFTKSGFGGRFESSSVSLNASYLILILFTAWLGWYIVLTRNNSSWVFSEPEKQVCRFAMASRVVSRSKSLIFLHVVEEEQCGVMDIWCTSGLRRIRRDPSITRGGLDYQWGVRLSTEKWCVPSMRLQEQLESVVDVKLFWTEYLLSTGCLKKRNGNSTGCRAW